MQILRHGDRRRGPQAWFTGEVWMESVQEPDETSRVQVARVSFAPSARTAWHTHPAGQLLYVLEGTGWVQLRGEPAQAITAGDAVRIAPGEDHWHGASSGQRLTHLAMQEKGDDGNTVVWGVPVSAAEYGAA